RLGAEYKNDLFVATLHGGAIFDFNLSPSRKSLALTGPLADAVADNSADNLFAEQSSILFASGFGTITDLTPGPGGMYVLSLTNGSLYRITTADVTAASAGAVAVPEPAAAFLILLLVCSRRRAGNSA